MKSGLIAVCIAGGCFVCSPPAAPAQEALPSIADPTSTTSTIAPAGKSTKVVIPNPGKTANNPNYVGTVGGTAEMLDRGAPHVDEQMVHVPAGMNMTAKIDKTISSETAQPGDVIQATLVESIAVGSATIPKGTVLAGHVVDQEAMHTLLGLGSHKLSLDFDTLRLPDGTTATISARAIKLTAQISARPLGSATTGSGVSATANTAGEGRLLEGIVLSRGSNTVIMAGEQLQVQLEAPASIAVIHATVL